MVANFSHVLQKQARARLGAERETQRGILRTLVKASSLLGSNYSDDDPDGDEIVNEKKNGKGNPVPALGLYG